jgi:hypothetical protein
MNLNFGSGVVLENDHPTSGFYADVGRRPEGRLYPGFA